MNVVVFGGRATGLLILSAAPAIASGGDLIALPAGLVANLLRS